MTLRAFCTVAVALTMLDGFRADVFAQDATIVFIVSEASNITPATSATRPGDTLVVTGEPDTMWLSDTYKDGFIVNDGTECAIQAAYPVQDIVAVDPGTGKHTDRIHNMMILSQPKPLEAGTKLADITSLGLCVGADITYKKFRAKVQKSASR